MVSTYKPKRHLYVHPGNAPGSPIIGPDPGLCPLLTARGDVAGSPTTTSSTQYVMRCVVLDLTMLDRLSIVDRFPRVIESFLIISSTSIIYIYTVSA